MDTNSTYTTSPHDQGFPKNDAVLGARCNRSITATAKEPYSPLLHTVLELMVAPASAEPLDGRLHLMSAVSIVAAPLTDALPCTAAG